MFGALKKPSGCGMGRDVTHLLRLLAHRLLARALGVGQNCPGPASADVRGVRRPANSNSSQILRRGDGFSFGCHLKPAQPSGFVAERTPKMMI